ncbi:hypothetical protein [Clostridium sp.]|uniref:hypothetical protein n=1 Tax=Clostridium sp. TaxID=1506 RepID=UPI003F4BB8DF
MIQYKLCKIFNENKSQTIKKLNEIYGDANLWFISDNIIGISYDYRDKDYKHILKSILEFKMNQIIITPTIFLQILKYCIDNNYFISQMSFLDSISVEDKEFVDYQVNLLNREEDQLIKEKQKNILVNELHWLTSDGCIDIRLIEFTIKTKNELYSNVTIYSNGVILIDDKMLTYELNNLISFII